MKRGSGVAKSLRHRRAEGARLDGPSLALALEPRFMYDAAGVATAAAVAPLADAASHQDAQGQDTAASDAGGEAGLAPAGGGAHAPLHAPLAEIVFVDARTPDIGALGARPGVEVVVLDASRDGIAQVNEKLSGYSGNLGAIHFVGHGESGAFGIGATTVNGAALSARAGEIARWGAALTADGDIMIWGCDVASLAGGQALIDSLAALTGADVAASTDTTGAAHLGGDWELEARTGAIEAAAPFEAAALAAWGHALDTPTITGTATILRVAEPSTLNDPGAHTASLAGWGFASARAGDRFTVTATVADTAVGGLVGAGPGAGAAASLNFTGTLAEVNGWLDGLSFVAADAERGVESGRTTITLTIANNTDAGPVGSRVIAVEVTPSNDPVTIADGSLTVVEGSSGTIVTTGALAALDPEVTAGSQNAAQIVYRLSGTPVHGYLTLGGVRIGTGSVFTHQDVLHGDLRYVHTATGAHQNTADSFAVLVNDGATPMNLSASATVAITITPVNQAPSIGGGGAVYEGQPANATHAGAAQSVVGNFITAGGGGDPQDTDDTLSLRLTAGTRHGTLWFTGAATIGGVSRNLVGHEITDADIAAGFVFAYTARDGLTYANDGLDDPATGRPPHDSFGVEVIDAGGGEGIGGALTTAGTIDITVRAVNDEPVWVETSTLRASVTDDSTADDPLSPINDPHVVRLTTAMLDVTDIDSTDENITFRITSQSGLDQGRLVFDDGGTRWFIPNGGTFTLADVKAGRVHYYQLLGAAAGETDHFHFQVLDNAVSPHWQADGAQFERPGGIYDGPLPTDALRDFRFTIDLREAPAGTGLGAGLGDLGYVVTDRTANYAGAKPGDVARGALDEGGTIVLGNGAGSTPGLSYRLEGVAATQVVYTVLSLDGDDFGGWNGKLQKEVAPGQWVALGVYDTFTQADLDAGRVRFEHDGGEDFESSVRLSASAGVLVSDGAGGLTPDVWETDFHFYVRPVNDAPVAAGSTTNVIDEGGTFLITSGQLRFTDPDDATSEARLEGADTLPGGGDNYAFNNGDALTFRVSELPAHGKLEYFDGAAWVDVTMGTVLQASWITGDAGSRLRYVHDGSETTSASFKVTATDRWGAASNEATVSFVVVPKNDAPQIAGDPTLDDPTLPPGPALPGSATGPAANEPLTGLFEGTYAPITAAMLRAIDSDSTSTQVQYRITAAPQHGRILYWTGTEYVTVAVGSSFTQQDVNDGRIFYAHNGKDHDSATYPADAPHDRFVFTLSDGAAEQTGNEFWIYTVPTNDAPVVSSPAQPIPSTDLDIAVPGFSVADADVIAAGGADDFLQVTVRLLKDDGTPFSLAEYGDATISHGAGSGATVVGGKDGNNDVLVLQGTRAQINAALAGLSVSFGNNHDAVYRLQVIADDRFRDAGGNLVDTDPATPGVQPGANGGGFNEPAGATPQAAPDAVPDDSVAIDYYGGAAIPAELAGNVSAASVRIFASTVNDPANLGAADTSVDVYEDQATRIGNLITFDIADPESDAFGTPVTVTLAVPSGTLNIGAAPDGITVTGRATGTLSVTGTASAIKDFLNGTLTYTSAANVNHDLNGAADGDVTLTVSLDDSGSRFGSGGAANEPAAIAIALTIIPVNDRPVVSSGSGTIPLTGKTAIPGFSVSDVDITGDGGAIAAGEPGDFLQVTVRITDVNGNPLAASQYSGAGSVIDIGSDSVPVGIVIDAAFNGSGSALVLRGTLADINAYLAGLTIDITGPLNNSDQPLRIEVIADDRFRDLTTGALSGTAANGGENANGAGGTSAVSGNAIGVYTQSIAQIEAGGLAPNVNAAHRTIFPTDVNDAATIDVPAQSRNEGSATYQFANIVIGDPDALDSDLAVTVTLDEGFTFTANGARTITFTGTLGEINAWVNGLAVNLPTTEGLATDWNGSFGVTIVVDDMGNNGSRPGSLVHDTDDPAANPGDFAFKEPGGTSPDLITTRSFTVTIGAVNDAPVVAPVNGGTETALPAIDEDTPAQNLPGRTVETLFRDYFNDAIDTIAGGSGADNFAGVVVTGLTPDAAEGAWQYSVDGGATWGDIGARTDATGLYLDRDALIRFVPAADYFGAPGPLTVRLAEDNAYADDPTGPALPASGGGVDVSGTGHGGTTRYSTGTVTLGITVTGVNDPPVARDDVNSVSEAGPGPGPAPTATGNVITGASPGDVADSDIDTPVADLKVVSIENGNGERGAVTGAPVQIDGRYGTLTINPDGSYVYAVNNSDPAVNALVNGDTLSDVFTYVISDGALDSNPATLTITINGTTDGPPAITPVDGNGPGVSGDATVLERGLIDGSGSGTATGAVLITAPEGLASISVGGTVITLAQLGDLNTTPVVVDTGKGRLTITGFTPTSGPDSAPTAGELRYHYELTAAQDQPGATHSHDDIALTVTDRSGTGANGTLSIRIVDDVPVANNDINALTRGAGSDTVGGNVVGASPGSNAPGADAPGADGATVSRVVSGDQSGAADLTGSSAVDPVNGAVVTGLYGTLTLHADGTYTYRLDNSHPDVAALQTGSTLTDVFTYRLTDADGDFDLAALTITINGKADGAPAITPADVNGPGANGHATVEERGLADGSDPASGTAATAGTIAVTAPNGLETVTVGGVTLTPQRLQELAATPLVIDTGAGLLTLTGFDVTSPTGGGTLTYTYVLKDNVIQPPGAGETIDAVPLSVTDRFNGSSNGALDIRIVNDAPQARDDVAAITEDDPVNRVSGNVFTDNDLIGADGFGPGGPVTGIAFDHDGHPATPDRTHAPGERFGTAYGAIVVNADGSYTYTLDNTNPAVTALADGETLVERVSYTITDGDGETSTATLTITIHGRNDAPVVTPGQVVNGREDTPLVLRPADFAFTDAEGDPLAAVRITALPPLGALLLDGVAVAAGDVIPVSAIAGGRLVYVPAPDGNGADYARFGFAVSDGRAFSASGVMRIDIAPVNDTPAVTGPARVVASEDTPLAFDGGTGADSAPRYSFDDLADRLGVGYTDAFTITLSVRHGMLTIAGAGSGASLTLTGTREALNRALATLTYLAEHDYSGTDQLVLVLDDHINAGTGPDARPGRVTHLTDIVIDPVADAPVLSAQSTTGTAGEWVALDIGVDPTDLSDVETVALDLSGLPAGWQIRAGDGAPLTSTGPDAVFHFTQQELAAGLAVLPPADYSGNITLDLLAISRDGPVSRAFTPGAIGITVLAAPRAPDPVVPPVAPPAPESVAPQPAPVPVRTDYADAARAGAFATDPFGVFGPSAANFGAFNLREGSVPDLEGWPIHRYTTTNYSVMQQVMFRHSGDANTSNLFFEATLGRNQALPGWISFDPYTQTVIALPGEDVQPGAYMVRVVARDAMGNEAEATVTIYVLRENERSIPGAQDEQPPQTDPQPETQPQQQEEQPGDADAPAGEAPADAAPAGEVPQSNAFLQPLSDVLIHAGVSGRTIEAAQLLEALAGHSAPIEVTGGRGPAVPPY